LVYNGKSENMDFKYLFLGGVYVPWISIFQGVTSLGVIAAFITAIFAGKKYFYEKNRDIYIRRLNEVYAPLYGLIMKQEKFRELFSPDVSLETAPIITSKRRTITHKIDLSTGTASVSAGPEATGLLDRNAFLKVLNDTNKGLARPKLLRLIYEYELLIYMEENTDKKSVQNNIASSEKVKIELKLVREIVSGYEDTINNLELDNTFISSIGK
jgi:hypothetical protein